MSSATPPMPRGPGAPAGASSPEPIWTPDEKSVRESRIVEFGEFVAERFGVRARDYHELWTWSVSHLDEFWSAVWEYFDVQSSTPLGRVLEGPSMQSSRWFTGTTVNYAEHALRHRGGSSPAVISLTEDGLREDTSWDDLRLEVGALRLWLERAGVRRGDRVVGYLPNGRHAVVALLATASLGAIWSSCGQDIGPRGAAARFGQLEPTVLIAADGYRWGGQAHDRRRETTELEGLLPSLRAVVTVSHLGLPFTAPGTVPWEEATSTRAEPVFEPVPFDEPLWVLFSSGTTGPPKGIVHGHGGVILEHSKMLALHFDLRAPRRLFWYTTTNWMMWNVVASGLLVGATIVLYDGSPTFPNPGRLFELASDLAAEVLGVSPGYLLNCERSGIEPRRDLDLSALRILASTGSPLPAGAYGWVRDHVGPTVQLNSTSGGTDVVCAFAGSSPTTPVWAGEVSAPLLGVALESWDSHARKVVDSVGELVITQPMPSMPIRFWNDPDGSRYHDAYYSTFPGVWRHGDWVTQTSRGTVIFSGRSDSTLNRHGVRIGSADIYDVVERLGEVHEALVIGAELPDGSYWMPLFVVLAPGSTLDPHLRQRINDEIRTHASPRHVPDEILEVPAIPHTRTGKKLEVPVKRLLQGAPPADVANSDSVDDPAALEYFTRFSPPE